MSATLTAYDAILREVYAPIVAADRPSLLLASPEWWAWAKEWREPIPLTAEQEAENAAWKAALPRACEEISVLRGEYDRRADEIEERYHVKIYRTDDDDLDVDEMWSEPPCVPGLRAKAGAPPEPPMWLAGQTITFRRA